MSFEYSKEIDDPPTYLDLNFVHDLTENALRKTDLKILKVHVTPGSSVGENFCSKTYRMRIEYELTAESKRGELSTFIKCIQPIEGINFIKDLKFFEKEKLTFEEVLPKLSAFLEPGERFSGRIYHNLKRPVNVLAFEDLNVSGFQMLSQSKGLDEKHARLVLKRVGQFHAISMHLAKRDTFIPKFYNNGFLAEPAIRPGAFVNGHCTKTSKAVQKLAIKFGYSDIAVKLQKYIDNLIENLAKAQAPRPDDHLRVLNHGDLWVNNLLFKYDQNNEVKDIAFIDFQLTFWGSPGIDLNYFLYTSLQLDVLKNKREELLKIK